MAAKHSQGRSSITTLAPYVAMWLTATATAMDADRTGGNPSTTGTHGTTLTDAACRSPQAPRTQTDGHECSPPIRGLNPRFVAWLMGLPDGWEDASRPLSTTACGAWATLSSRSLERLHCACSRSGWE